MPKNDPVCWPAEVRHGMKCENARSRHVREALNTLYYFVAMITRAHAGISPFG